MNDDRYSVAVSRLVGCGLGEATEVVRAMFGDGMDPSRLSPDALEDASLGALAAVRAIRQADGLDGARGIWGSPLSVVAEAPANFALV